MRRISGAGLHRWYLWLNYIKVAEGMFSHSEMWGPSFYPCLLSTTGKVRWKSFHKHWLQLKKPEPLLKMQWIPPLQWSHCKIRAEFIISQVQCYSTYPTTSRLWCDSCLKQQQDSLTPAILPQLQTHKTQTESPWLLSGAIQAHLPQPCSAPQGRGAWWGGRLWWIASAWWNVPSHWTRSQMHSQAGSAAALIQAGCSQPVHKTEQKKPISLVPRQFHCNHLQCKEMMWSWLGSACVIQTKELQLII